MKYFALLFFFCIKSQDSLIQSRQTGLSERQTLFVDSYYKQLAEIEKGNAEKSLIAALVPKQKLETLRNDEIKAIGHFLAFCDCNESLDGLLPKINDATNMFLQKYNQERLINARKRLALANQRFVAKIAPENKK